MKECCLVWFQLAFAAGAMLLFAFPYIHIGAKLGFGKILGRKFDLWKMLGGLQVCLCSFLMMDVTYVLYSHLFWARLPSWPRFFQMGWYGGTLGIVPLTINPIYTEKLWVFIGFISLSKYYPKGYPMAFFPVSVTLTKPQAGKGPENHRRKKHPLGGDSRVQVVLEQWKKHLVV